MKLGIRWLVSILTCYCVGSFLPELFSFTSFASVIVFGTVILILGMTLKPLLLLIALPLSLITLGLMTFVVNGFVLCIADAMIGGVKIHGFLSAIVLSVIFFVLQEYMQGVEHRRANR